ncbi:natural resistance-associated macrophage protein-domain-containing protein [Polychytrium aggregatum]|uniref:natural resistance-associated macrophage protein-domain-containing protein n=1 Tax=Polychytrium aggregatum TaxID=110093 RepID=UPI0022FECB3F|nr:natural resistance-associated macrophage protein-domain-containing protein [Polychytrium aggregatum]KAI9207781.1 natural resistance-associated macrophage protein-domain-containing protein [Polychytrium aggregatum]
MADDSHSTHIEPGPAPRKSVLLRSELRSWIKTLVAFMGPGYIVAVGYMDPGNWATDLQGGSVYQYKLLFIIFLSNVFAVLFQSLSAKIGIVTGRDLSQLCRKHFHPWLNYILYFVAEVAVMATDLAEIIGAAISLKLLLGIPLIGGIILTTLDVFLVLVTFQAKYMRIFEFIIIVLVLMVGICYAVLLSQSAASGVDVLKGYLPLDSTIFTDPTTLYVGMSILGATVMPHNLFIHSRLVQYRSPRQDESEPDESLDSPGVSADRRSADRIDQITTIEDGARTAAASIRSSVRSKEKLSTLVDGTIRASDPLETDLRDGSAHSSEFVERIKSTLSFTMVDSAIALTFALYVNSAILIVSAALFYSKNQQVSDIPSAYNLIKTAIAPWAATLFAFALFCAGQSSSITGTLAGQIVMEGFLKLKWPMWARRLTTRAAALIPAVVVVIIKGDAGINDLLVLSQAILSGCLPFALWPLLWFSSSKHIMSIRVKSMNGAAESSKSFASSWFITIFTFLSILLITGLDILMIYQAIAGTP